ncbi:MAG: hypothetical protein MZV63_10125 [Marinilabiliales bacterium]|nr:hypothetical protein [Marinilabiliales bacterium]
MNIPPEAAISEEQIFGTYAAFQGFQDQLLNNLVDYNNHGARVTHSIGGEALSPSGQSVFGGNNGDYNYLLTNRGIYALPKAIRSAAGLYSSYVAEYPYLQHVPRKIGIRSFNRCY